MRVSDITGLLIIQLLVGCASHCAAEPITNSTTGKPLLQEKVVLQGSEGAEQKKLANAKATGDLKQPLPRKPTAAKDACAKGTWINSYGWYKEALNQVKSGKEETAALSFANAVYLCEGCTDRSYYSYHVKLFRDYARFLRRHHVEYLALNFEKKADDLINSGQIPDMKPVAAAPESTDPNAVLPVLKSDVKPAESKEQR